MRATGLAEHASPAGRVTESGELRFGQENGNQMAEHPGLGDLGTFAGRTCETDQALQPLECDLYAPPQPVEIEHLDRRIIGRCQRGDEDHPSAATSVPGWIAR